MLDELAFKKKMALLGEIHQRKISEALIQIYWEKLEDFGDEECIRVFDTIIDENKFFPKPCELLELLRGTKDERASIAWLAVEKAVKLFGQYDSVDFAFDKTINSTIEAIGGWVNFQDCTMDQWKWKQKDFEKMYPIMQRRRVHPDYLPGLIEESNFGRGFDVPKPVRIGVAGLRMLPEGQKQQLQIVAGGNA